DEIREGIRRIGEVVKEQVDLYGTLTGELPAAPAGPRADGDEGDDEGARVFELPRRADAERRARRS
nr:PLP-dependent aminotransferase family protein [Solirubrobacterales bacterium]